MKQHQNKISRRSFLGGAALISAAGVAALSGCTNNAKPAASSSEIAWAREVDVIIVGGGGTGLAAAVEAAQAGAETLVLEKAPSEGGTTKLSGGMVCVAGTKYQKEFKGYEGDTPQKHFDYYMAAGGDLLDEALVKDYCDTAPKNLEWLEGLGIKYVNCFGVKPVPGVPLELSEPPRILIPGDDKTGKETAAGTGYVHTDPIYAKAQELGATFEFNVEVKALIRDPEQGVIGVKVVVDKQEEFIKARRGVVVGTGGYEHNMQMALAYSYHTYDSLNTKAKMCISSPMNTGDGHRMCMEVGAAFQGMGGTMNTPITAAIGRDPGGSMGTAHAGIGVNIHGARFCNEWTTYPYYFTKSYEQDTSTTWIITDSKVIDLGPEAYLLGTSIEEALESKMLFKADSVEALAELVGINPQGLRATLDKWNSDMTTTGMDTVFGKTEGLDTIDTAPFYAVPDYSANLGTLGGIKINTDSQVLDWEDNPIPRLYAGGMCTGGWIGRWYPSSGTAVGGTVHWGRKAGIGAAGETPIA